MRKLKISYYLKTVPLYVENADLARITLPLDLAQDHFSAKAGIFLDPLLDIAFEGIYLGKPGSGQMGYRQSLLKQSSAHRFSIQPHVPSDLGQR